MIECKLFCSSSSEHLLQIYAGFSELANRKLIRLHPIRMPGYSGKMIGNSVLRAEIERRYRVVYDTSDTHHLSHQVDLNEVDFYFKRSYRPEMAMELPQGDKIHPLGLGYLVYSRHDFLYRRALWSADPRDVVVQLLRANAVLSRLLMIKTSVFTSEIGRFEGTPKTNPEPLILFITRLWRPERAATAEKADEREHINSMRADCIRLLRKEFGARFVGGLIPTEYAQKYYPDVVLEDARIIHKHRYLNLMHQADICVTTAGLEGSNSWKLAEYVAASKAIVAERLNHFVPGDFKAGKNYLEFTTAKECAAKVVELYTHPEERWTMAVRNLNYYYHYLRPDALIWNSLMTVLRRNAVTIYDFKHQSLSKFS
jgi:hypothetical protein